MTFDALRIKCIVYAVLCEYNVDDVVTDVPLPLQLQAITYIVALFKNKRWIMLRS